MTNVLPDATKNALLNSAVAGGLVTTASHMALHTGFPPAVNPGNEVTGGSPAYARKAIDFTATAAAGAISPSSGLPATFDIPAGTTVRAISIVDAASGAATVLAWSPAGAATRIAINVPDAAAVTANIIYSEGHGLVNGNSVLVWATEQGNLGLPPPLAEDTEYFVVGAATDNFQLSATLGGAAIDITDEGVGDAQKFTPEVFAGQGTYQVSTYTVSLPG